MKKVSLVVMDKYREASLEKLREIGAVHLEGKNASSDTLTELVARKAGVEAALALLNPYAAEIAKGQKQAQAASGAKFDAQNEGQDFFRRILKLEEERKILREKADSLSREQGRIKDWGDFDPAGIQLLKDNNIALYLYEFTHKTFNSLPDDVRYVVIKKGKAVVYAAVLDSEVSGETPVEPGKYSLSALNALVAETANKLADIENDFFSLCSGKSALEQELENLSAQIEFQTASAGMETLGDTPAESTVSWLSGFIPADKMPLLKETAGANGWALAWDDPAPEDHPPTLLKNGALARIIQPLFSFLGTVPGYREFDISPSYLLFFSVFFAMIVGDAAYGLIILGIALGVGFSVKKKSGAFPDIAKLLLLLSCMTIAWGAAIGSWFMIPHSGLPAVLTALILPPFNNSGPLVEFPLALQSIFKLPAKVPIDELKTQWSIQFLCFTIAVSQLAWARGKRFARLLPSLSAIAQLGWLVMMLGLYFLVLSMLLGIEFPSFAPLFIGGGIAFILVFSEQKGGNFFINIGKGFAGLFSLFLKTVSCFADIISYIRLFAVGMAGAMIGMIFNQMAFPAEGLGSFGVVFIIRFAVAVLLVVFGHSLNLALASLSVIVHGVRLNLLEYAGNHLEMEWSGYAYNPFARKQKGKL